MFKNIGTHEARNEHGTRVIVDGPALRYILDERVLELGAQMCPPLEPKYDAMFMIYVPTDLKWLAPHRSEEISFDQGQQMESDIVEALAALDCQVEFTVPVEG